MDGIGLASGSKATETPPVTRGADVEPAGLVERDLSSPRGQGAGRPRLRVLRDEPGARGRLIARILTGAWRMAPPPPDFTADELEAAAPLLHKGGSGALVWWRIRGTPLAETPTGQGFRNAYRLCTLEAEIHAIEMVRVLQRLDAAGVETLVAKGWVAARPYPEVGLRQYTDLDLLVRPAHVVAARTALGSLAGLDYLVDLHEGARHLDALSFDDLAARAEHVKVGERDVCVLGPEDHLRVLAVHALRHGVFRPLWLVDLAVAMEARPADFDWTRCLGPDPRRADWVACALGLSHRLLGADLDSELVEARARRLPDWLLRAVLRAWDRCEDPSLHEPFAWVLARELRRPARVVAEIRRRWDRPIQATVAVGGPFNRLPRWPFRLAAIVRHAPRIGRVLRQTIGARAR
jgi:Uncharacterised nucleotidyltransferase